MEYLIIYIILLILSNRYIKNNENKFLLMMIILFLFAALRGNGDGDYFTYKEYAKYVKEFKDVLEQTIPMEIGFRSLAYIVNKAELNLQWVIIGMNIISLTCIYKFIKKVSPDIILSVIIFFPYFLQFDMHASRTAVAMGFGCLAIYYLINEKVNKYLIYLLLAASFHKTAIILILVIFIKNIKIEFLTSLVILGIALIFGTVININNIIVSILDFLNLYAIKSQYITYIMSTEYGYRFSLLDPRLILAIITYFSCFMPNLSMNYRNTRVVNICKNILMIGITIMIIFSRNTIIVNRVSSYFTIISIVLIPLILYEMRFMRDKNQTGKIFRFMYSIAYIAYSCMLILQQVEYKLYFLV